MTRCLSRRTANCVYGETAFQAKEDQQLNISVELTKSEVAQLQQITRLPIAAEAVGHAAREFLRLSRLRELKAVSGKVGFDDNWRDLEALELNEVGFPS